MSGRVAIVGAGPGDPELITVKGRRLLEEADVVVHDRLVSRELLTLATRALIIDAGKLPGGRASAQDEIDALLVRLAREGKRVVRLQGGDPTVFGRISSELEALVAAGIPFEIVPGVTSAIAAPAYAGIPVTDRRLASAVAFVTAIREGGTTGSIDWPTLARMPTLVILMGAARIEESVRALIDAGASPSRPAAAIEWATTPKQRVVRATLADLPREVRAQGLGSPLTIVVGDVAALGERYAWFTPPA